MAKLESNSHDIRLIAGISLVAVAAVCLGGYLVMPRTSSPVATATPPQVAIARDIPPKPSATPTHVMSPAETPAATPAKPKLKAYPATDAWGRPVNVVRSDDSPGFLDWLSGAFSAGSSAPTTRPDDGTPKNNGDDEDPDYHGGGLAQGTGTAAGGSGTVHVNSYTNSHGTYVNGYNRSAPGSGGHGGGRR